jgi:hypothetical protein
MNINWPLTLHTIVGVIITGSQAIAVTYPANTQLVNVCHIITLITIQIGVSLGVWQSQQISFAVKKAALLDRAKNLMDAISRSNVAAQPASGVPEDALDDKELDDLKPAEPVKVKETVEVKETVAPGGVTKTA